ncbi:hypothetical protein HPB47_004610, partial [Ixodes persulcatus]
RGASLTEVSQCAVCGQSKPSAEITVKYGQRSCRFCFSFYNRFLRKPIKFRCMGEVPGSCNLSRKLKCKGCLLHACWTLFEIPATQKQHLQRHLVHLTGGPKHRQLTRKRKSSRSVEEGGLGTEGPSEMPKPVLSSPEDSLDAQISSSDSSKVSKGPRIKHVCRRAAVVLGHERATFSPPSSRISLSALSEEDKNLLVRGALEDTDSSPDKKEEVDKRKRREKEERVREKEERIREKVKDKEERVREKEERMKEKVKEKEERVKEKEEKAKEKERVKEEKERVKEEKEREQVQETEVKKEEVEQAKEEDESLRRRPTRRISKKEERVREKGKEKEERVREKAKEKEERVREKKREETQQRSRKGRCHQCAGCLAEDCGECINCRDKKKFGGKNLLKQACSYRRCLDPVPSSRTEKDPPEPVAEKTSDAPERSSAAPSEATTGAKTPVASKLPGKPSLALQKKRLLAQPLRSYKSKVEQSRRLLLHTAAKKAKSKSKSKVTSKARAAMMASRVARKNGWREGGPVAKRETDDAVERRECKLEEGTGCDDANAASTRREWDRDVGGTVHSLDRVGGASSSVGRLQDKLQPKAYPPLVPKVVEHPLSSRQLSKKSVGHGNQPLVQSLFGEEEYRRAQIIATGFALVSSRRFAVQAVCFLCASAGEEELLFCTVCCEPYHWFCLDPEEAPQGLDKESWCCPRCQTCIACGHRSSQLLRCSKCQQTYHTDCLGPGYPSKPSRKKKIWLCVKCIRCKSCGTSSKQSAWNFDLSLCQDCMLLREKGNYCPLCEKCYEDDDYESMMVQCSQCQKWIHARCDGISEELYQVLSLLPETELYLCRICEPNSPRLWLGTAERVLQDRLRCIMNSLLELQKASKDKCQVLEQAVPTPPDLLMLPDEVTDPSLDSVQPMAVWRTEIHFVDLIAVQRKLECGEYTAVKEFCEDILQAAIASRVSVQMVRELLAKLLEEAFPGLRPSPLPPTPPHEPSDMPCGLLPDAVLPPHADHVYAQYLPKEDSPPVDQPGVLRGCEQGSLADSRRCVLCGQPGDDTCTKSGRLIYAGQDDWVHVNCALWSAEVFEHVDGSLHRVHSAIWRGRCLRCELCGNVGATVGCCVRGCPANFHFGCARAAQAVFQADRRVFCSLHQGNINREVVEGDKFAVCHAVYISQQDVNSKWQKAWQEKIAKGISVITEVNVSHHFEGDFWVRCRRLFWSTQNPRQRVVYTCRTYEVRPPRPPPQEDDWGVNVTTAHADEPYAPPPYSPPREGPPCDIASASCDSSRTPPRSRVPTWTTWMPRSWTSWPKCVQGNDSHLDFAELLENISRSCDPAKGCGGSGADGAGGSGDYGVPPVPDRLSSVAQPLHTRQNGAADSAKAVDASSLSEEQRRDCAKVSAEARAGATAPPPPASRGANYSAVGANQSPKCTKPVKQPQSSCGCTCEGRAAGRTVGKVATAATPSRARSRPTASPKTILPKVAGAQSCQRVRACQMQQPQQQQVVQAAPPCMGLPPVAQPAPLDLSRLVSYSPYAYNIPVINQYPSTINMTSVSCDKFEVYEVPGGTIIIPRHHYRLENCVSTLSVAGAQVAYLGSLPLVAAPFMQPATTPLAFIGGLGGQAPVMPLALQPPAGVCGQVPLVAGSGLVANPGMVGPGIAAGSLMASMTSSTMVNGVPGGTSPAPPHPALSTQRTTSCCVADQRKKTVVAQKQCTKSVVVRNRVVQSSRGGGKSVVTQSRSSFVSQQQCTKCVVLPEHVPHAVAAGDPPEAGPVPAVSSSAVLPPAPPVPSLPPRSRTSPDLYPEPDSSTAEDLFGGPGRVSPDLLPPPQPPFSPSPQASPRGDSGSLGAESIFALLQKAAQRILQDGWPADADADPVPPPPLPAPEAKEPVHSTVNLPLPRESRDRLAPFDRPYVVYEISSEDGFLHSSHDVHEAWRYVFEKLQDARAAANLQPLTADDVDGFSMMGLTHKTVVYLTEQLRGADNCVNYCFKFHKRNSVKLAENPSGCARLEQFESRGDHDMFKFLASAHRCPPRYDPSESGEEVEVLHKSSRRLTSLDLPMAMRFRHLKNTAKEAVGVYRSSIHGRGLYCKRNIDGGEMIIEYAGEVIRAALTDKREKYYESKGIGCYMFRIDDHEVVDATMHGNAARFINHSCEPNCYSKVITVDNKKHIVIFALRSILKGEELTYDYKFPIEEVKIPCSCGSRRFKEGHPMGLRAHAASVPIQGVSWCAQADRQRAGKESAMSLLRRAAARPMLAQRNHFMRMVAPPSSWTIIADEQGTRVVVAKDDKIFVLDPRGSARCIEETPPITTMFKAVTEMAVSFDYRNIALFLDDGHLWIGTSDLRVYSFTFQSTLCELDTKEKSRPKQLLWCGQKAVVGHWGKILLCTISSLLCTYPVDVPIHLVQEVDGVRLIGNTIHELLQKVPNVVKDVFRIGSMDPGALLLAASVEFEKKSYKADEYLRSIIEENNLELAIQQCIDAAAHEYPSATQKKLLRAACFGKSFIPSMNPDGFVNACRTLRVLNAVREHTVGLPLTYVQRASLKCYVCVQLEVLSPLIEHKCQPNTGAALVSNLCPTLASVYTVMLKLKEMKSADFDLTIRQYPVALALYLK